MWMRTHDEGPHAWARTGLSVPEDPGYTVM